jgi:hypothetical protein
MPPRNIARHRNFRHIKLLRNAHQPVGGSSSQVVLFTERDKFPLGHSVREPFEDETEGKPVGFQIPGEDGYFIEQILSGTIFPMDMSEIVDRRREIVRHLAAIGTAIPIIIQKLHEHGDSFVDPLLTYKQKVAIIKQDINHIRKDAHKALDAAEGDAKDALREYLVKCMYLYDGAIQMGDLRLAKELNEKIAMAKGVQVNEPVVVKNDFLTAMRNAADAGRARAAKPVVVDITPPPAEAKQLENKPIMNPLNILAKKPVAQVA